MASTIQIKRGTGSALPTGLADGELAINLDNRRLYFGSGSTSINDFSFGEITAEKYIVSSSVLYVTTSFSSGSTEFGDTADDTHTFTGHVTASGNISSSGVTEANVIRGNELQATFNGSPRTLFSEVTNAMQWGEQNITSYRIGKPTSNSQLKMEGSITASGDISASGDITANSIRGTVGTPTQGTIDHDSLSNFVANEHIDHSGVSITAGAGLTGGGTIAATRDIAIGAGTGVTVNANDVAIGQDVATTANVLFNHITASGNVSASGNIITDQILLNDGNKIIGHHGTDGFQIRTQNTDPIVFKTNGNNIRATISSTGEATFTNVVNATKLNTGQGDNELYAMNQDVETTDNVLFNDITATGNVSSSGDIYSSRYFANEQLALNNVNGAITLGYDNTYPINIGKNSNQIGIYGNITASSNISASGNNYASEYYTDGYTSLATNGTQGRVFSDADITGIQIGRNGSSDRLIELLGPVTASGNISASGTVTANSIIGTVGTATQGTIDHDSLANFVANEHIDHSGVSITAGAGLTGGGTIASTRDIAVGAGTGITVNTNDIAIGQDVATTANVLFNHITASGDISASGTVLANNLYIKGYNTVNSTDTALRFGYDSALTTLSYGQDSDTSHFFYGAAITASGDISASGTITGLTGSFNQLSVLSSGDTGTPPLEGHLFRVTDTTNNNPDIDHFFVENEGLAYGMRWHYDGGDNDFELYRHDNDTSGTPVIKFNRGNDNIVVYGSLTGVSTLGGQTDAVLNINSDSDIIYTTDVDGDEVGQHIFKDRTATLLTVDETGADFPSNITASGDISSSGTITANSIIGTVGTATQGTIDHDSLANFVANEHIDHSGVSVIAGTGLTGGGTIAANRTLNVIGGTGVTANANDIAIGQDVATTANVLFNHITASGNISASLNSKLYASSASFGGAAFLRSFNVKGVGLEGRLSLQGASTSDNPGIEMTVNDNTSRVLMRLNPIGSNGTELSIFTEPDGGSIAEAITVESDGNLELNSHDIKGVSNITSSGNISASGTITADKVVSDNIQAGWHGSTTRIKILVSDFIPDDVGRPAMIDDTGSDRWLESHGTAKLFASLPIPTGFKATHVRIYGSATSALEVSEMDIDSKSVTSKGTGNIGTELNITDVTSTATNYLLLELAQASGEEVYGGYVTIAAV